MPTKQVETKPSRSESNPRAMSELLPLNRKWQKGEVENSLILSMWKKRWSLRRIFLTSKRGRCAKTETEERKSVHSFPDNWGKTLFCSHCDIYLKLTSVSLSQLCREKVKTRFRRSIVSNYYSSHSSFNETHIVILLGWQPLQIEISLRSRVSPTARNLT